MRHLIENTSVTENLPQPDYLRLFLLVLEFTISCLFLGIPYFFIGRSRGHIVDEENGPDQPWAATRHLACSVLLAFLFCRAWTVSTVLQALWRSYLRPAGCHQTFLQPSLKRNVVVSPF
ncbi:hypothetical protein JOM56_001753 [Amanita muscaria]